MDEITFVGNDSVEVSKNKMALAYQAFRVEDRKLTVGALKSLLSYCNVPDDTIVHFCSSDERDIRLIKIGEFPSGGYGSKLIKKVIFED